MPILRDNQIKLYMETKDGHVLELTGNVVGMSTTYDWNDIGGRTTVDLRLVGLEKWFTSSFMRDQVAAKTHAVEWHCDYCGRANSREQQTCKSCGAVRSFIYG